jgi:hypothetical protein
VGGVEQGQESEPTTERVLGPALVAQEAGDAGTLAAELKRDLPGLGLGVEAGRFHACESALASRRRPQERTLDWTLECTL